MFWAVPHHQTPAWVEQLHGQDLVQAVEEHVDNLLEHFEARVHWCIGCIGIDLSNMITVDFPLENMMIIDQ